MLEEIEKKEATDRNGEQASSEYVSKTRSPPLPGNRDSGISFPHISHSGLISLKSGPESTGRLKGLSVGLYIVVSNNTNVV